MNDRTRWENSPNAARNEAGGDYRQQGGDNARHRERAPSQSHDWQGQQGGWHDDDRQQDHRFQDRRPQEWQSGGYRQQGSGWSDQPQQREWRGAERAWGGSSQSSQYGSGSSAQSYRQDEGRAERLRRAGSQGYAASDDLSGRPYQGGSNEYSRDDWRSPGSQSFAGGYGMIDGPRHDRASYERAGYDRAGGYASGYGGSSSSAAFGRGYGPDYGRDEGRGFLDRAGDAIASWFGDDDAAERRDRERSRDQYRQSFRGHGPSDYTRSDERIREDANDRLTDDHRIDARRISVAVSKGEVTLSGTVSNRDAKRRAEDCIEGISGVRHVQNNLRVEDAAQAASSRSTEHKAGQTGTATSASGTGAATGTAATDSTSAGTGKASAT